MNYQDEFMATSILELPTLRKIACSETIYRAFSRDVTVAVLVFQNDETVTAAMLVYPENPLGVELFSHVNAFFCSN